MKMTMGEAKAVKERLKEQLGPDFQVGLDGNPLDGYGVHVGYTGKRPELPATIDGVPITVTRKWPNKKLADE